MVIRSIILIITGLLFSGQSVFAQALTSNNALITVEPSTRVTIQGGALNNGDLVNHGTVSVSGDWMNVDTYTPANGLLIFNGAGTQNIAHNNGLVYQLSIEGGGEKSIIS